MKKIFILFLLLLLIPNIVSAKTSDNYVINKNNVSIEKNEYLKLCDIYSKEFIDFLTLEEYKKITSVSLDEIVVSEYNGGDRLLPLDSSHNTNSKKIRLVKSGNYVTLLNEWTVSPVVKSYDVIAVRFDNVSVIGSYSFSQVYTSSTGTFVSYDSYNKSFSNGYGCSFQLLNASNLTISLSFSVSGSGKIYGSYQHATSNVSLTDSTKYSISSSGYGGVILFDSGIRSKYDAMGGVDISV